MNERRFRSNHLTAVILPFLLAALGFTAPALSQSCDEISFRIWRPDAEATYYAKGELIRLEPGIEAHLYVHHQSQSATPYTTSAAVGDPKKLGIRGQYDASVLALRPQNDNHRRTGHVIIDTKSAGRTRLGYRISGIAKDGLFNRLPEACRQGLVTVQVDANDTRPGTGAGSGSTPEARKAARGLTHTLEKALLPWLKAEVDAEELAMVLRDGREGLVRHAGQLMRSEAFQNDSYEATIDADPTLSAQYEREGDLTPASVANVALEVAYRHLYGEEIRPEGKLHKANLELLLDCVTRDGSRRDYGCDTLAERLLASPAYTQRHRDALDAINRDR